MTFNKQSFDWKKAIWETAQRLTALEERVNNELVHQLRFNRWFMGILGGIIVGLTIFVIKYILTG